MWDAHRDQVEGERGLVMLEEACRIADRLDRLDALLRGDPDHTIGPGHNSVVRDSRGTDWIVYHAVDAGQTRTRPEDEPNTRRVMLIDRLVWADGWPRAAGPSEGPQTAPAARR